MRAKKYVRCKGKNGKIIVFPIYKCEKCGRLYTFNYMYSEGQKIRIDEIVYINLLPQKNSTDYENVDSIKVQKIKDANFYIYWKKINACKNENCNNNRLLESIYAHYMLKNGDIVAYKTKRCRKCELYYLKYSLFRNLDFQYNIINEEKIKIFEDRQEKSTKNKEEKEKQKIREQQEKKKQIDKEIEEYRKKYEKIKEKNSQKKKDSNQKREDVNKKKKNKKGKNDWLEKARQTSLVEPDYYLKQEKMRNRKTADEIPIINYRDFVVRSNIFKCIHNNHTIMDIIASISIIDKDDKERVVKVNAGYCQECGTYFILESTYKYLKRLGIILCRISDEKNYLGGTNGKDMKLASESILMQYGYNVNQEKGLSELNRHKILAVLIDRHIMSKNEIISYIDFFINQRKSNSKFQVAIGKWEADRSFVEEYKVGKYKEIGVLGLRR
ncbi:hypothetical protein [Eubacterium uniforme]|nr:hypothetical protein [Eubacterium uniforme]